MSTVLSPAPCNGYPGFCWAHEEPHEIPNAEAEPKPLVLFGPPPSPSPEPEPDRPCQYLTVDGKPRREHAAPLPIVENPEASRPCHQFKYQVAKELQWLRGEWAIDHPGKEVPDLAERAYTSIKAFWIEKNLWNKKRGIVPGMKWAHEEGEQPAAQMEEQAECMLSKFQPFCSHDCPLRIDRPANGNNADGGTSHDTLEAEEQLRPTIPCHAGRSQAPKHQKHTPKRVASCPELQPEEAAPNDL
ncbi:unnamed protein product [Clonostachys rosea]|uniref:Uncharacterized protein n=1 Tax=Bionectria ochroleuca TaxID=29856 RepID=A0ABY6U398_BIOOC|nr:unnamed protein product [Clonostachys rosea]